MKLAVILLLPLLSASAADLRLGRAAVVITPPVGMPMGGSYGLRLSTGVLDDLHAKALVIEVDGTRAALVACDLVAISEPVIHEARRLIQQATALGPDQVMISATHTHSGPLMGGRGARDKAFGGDLEVSKQYMAALPEKIAESVRLAAANLAPARLSAAIGHEDTVSFNRRFLMKDGSYGWNPGKRNPNIVRPAGPIDPEVAVVYFDSPDSKPSATYVNHALHVAVTGGTRFSSDFPGVIARRLAAAKSPEMLTVFTIGAAGNVNHIDVSDPARQGGPTEAARIGAILAAEILRAFDRLQPIDPAPLSFRREVVKLPLPEIRSGEMEKAHAVIARFGTPNPPPFLELVNAVKVADIAARDGRPVDGEVQVITLGDQIAFVGLPGEMFVELGLAIKQNSPFPYTIVAELAGPWIGYVPNRKAYTEGNYEPVSARCAAGCGEMLADSALRQLVDLYRAKPR